MLKIYTSQFRYNGANRTDVTVKSAKTPWDVFAPTWDMVMTYLKGPKDGMAEQVYIEKYTVIVAKAYQKHYESITTLIHSNDVRVLVCFCSAGAFCHRVLLAKHLESLGTEYCGEIDTTQPFRLLEV